MVRPGTTVRRGARLLLGLGMAVSPRVAARALTAAASAPHAPPGCASGFPVQLTLVGFASPQALSDAGVSIGRERGFFREHGIDVDVLTFQSGPDTITVLASGDPETAGRRISTALLSVV